MTRTARIIRRAATGTALASVAPLLFLFAAPASRATTTAAGTVPRCGGSGLAAWLGVGAGAGSVLPAGTDERERPHVLHVRVPRRIGPLRRTSGGIIIGGLAIVLVDGILPPWLVLVLVLGVFVLYVVVRPVVKLARSIPASMPRRRGGVVASSWDTLPFCRMVEISALRPAKAVDAVRAPGGSGASARLPPR